MTQEKHEEIVDFIIYRPLDCFFVRSLQKQEQEKETLKPEEKAKLILSQKNRFEERIKQLKVFIHPHRPRGFEECSNWLKKASIAMTGEMYTPPPHFIFRMFTDAHYRMHYIEHLRSSWFQRRMEEYDIVNDETERLLKFCIVVNTFIFSIMRTAPWIFAKNAGRVTINSRQLPEG